MLKNYFKVAWRNLKGQKLYSAINILGLTVGLSSFLLIYLYLNDELTYDQFHNDYEDIYRFSYWRQWDSGEVQAMATSGSTWGPHYKDLIPEVEDFVRLTHSGYPGYVNRENDINAFMEPRFYWVDHNFFEVFNFPLKIGDKATLFSQLNSVVISESAAIKYFGDEDPLGKVIAFNHNAGEIQLTVSGVMFDAPGNSHLKPEFLGSIEKIHQFWKQTWQWELLTQNGDAFVITYLKLSDKNALSKISEDWKKFVDNRLVNNPNNSNNQPEQYKEVKFTAIADMHFEPEMKWELESPANSSYIPVFSITALLVLVIACINFMNLATARSAKRAKEVGLRKTLGSSKSQLIAQFYSESFLMTIISIIISLGIMLLSLPYFNELTDKALTASSALSIQNIAVLTGLALIVGLLSGSYPALYLSGFKPLVAIRGLFSAGRGAENIRKGLVIFQFAVSIILIISALVVSSQLKLINTSKLGKDKDRILSIRLGGFGLGDEWQVFRDQIEQDTRFESVTVGNHLPRLPHFGLINRKFKFPDENNQELEWNKFDVDFNFPKTFNLEFIAGRNFDPNIISDSTGVLLNEAAVKNMQKAPEEVIGMTIRDRVWNNQLQQQVEIDGRVIGVVKDFPYKSVNEIIEPLTIWGTPSWIDRILYVKMTAGNYQEKLEVLESKWKEVIPGFPMENWFLDFEFGRLYENERRMSSIFTLFSGITIFIAVLGLFALTSYTTEQRRKEIGVRKVLGASNQNLVTLLLSHFFKLVIAAFVIAVPVAWLLMDNWLDSFVYRVQVSVWIILTAGLSVALVTLMTVGYDTYRTAIANPVKALRTE